MGNTLPQTELACVHTSPATPRCTGLRRETFNLLHYPRFWVISHICPTMLETHRLACKKKKLKANVSTSRSLEGKAVISQAKYSYAEFCFIIKQEQKMWVTCGGLPLLSSGALWGMVRDAGHPAGPAPGLTGAAAGGWWMPWDTHCNVHTLTKNLLKDKIVMWWPFSWLFHLF